MKRTQCIFILIFLDLGALFYVHYKVAFRENTRRVIALVVADELGRSKFVLAIGVFEKETANRSVVKNEFMLILLHRVGLMENDCTELAEETIVNQPFHLNVQIEVLANLLYFFYEVTILLF